MPTKAQILQETITSYRSRLAARRGKDLSEALDAAEQRISEITNLADRGVKIDDATAQALAADANSKIAAYNAAAVLPAIDIADLGAQLAAADDA